MKKRIRNINLVTATGVISNGAIDVADGVITAVYREAQPQTAAFEEIDGEGCYAAPGFVDLHVHGGGGVEFMNASPEEVEAGCMAHARHGTTTILPTTLAAPLAQTLPMIAAVRAAQQAVKCCSIAGIHLEGPFLSPVQSGAQSPEALCVPTEEVWTALLQAWPGGIRMMGAAPELPGAMELAEALQARGIVASIAHSDADYDTCRRAMTHGYCDVTHLYSGCSSVRRTRGYRAGGVVEAGLLEDGLTVQVIADGKHLPPELLRLIVKCKTPQRIALITDALFAAGADLPDGTLLRQANGMTAILEDGVLMLPSREAFAGSAATMDVLVRNMVNLAGVPLWDAVTMAAATPARIIGLDKRKGRLAPGFDADIVLLDQDLQVRRVMAKGHTVAGGSMP